MSHQIRRNTLIASLVLLVFAGSAHAGVISDMITKRRMQRQMNSQNKAVMPNPFHGAGVGGGMKSPTLKDKFQKRFAVNRNGRATPSPSVIDGVFGMARDTSNFKVSR